MEDVQPTRCPPGNYTQQSTLHWPSDYMDLKEETRAAGDRTDQPRPTNKQPQIQPHGADYAPLHPRTRLWEVARDHVTREKIIGKGAFCQVAKGTATDLRSRPGKTTVAVKMLKCKTPLYLKLVHFF